MERVEYGTDEYPYKLSMSTGIDNTEQYPTVEAIPKADYENRLKADLVAILEEIDLQFDEISFCKKGEWKTVPAIKSEYKAIIQQKINELSSVTPQEPTDKNFTKAELDSIVKAINSGWELRVNEVLDKIRAEILKEHGYSKDYVGTFNYSTIKVATVLMILDEYKAAPESEETDD